MNYCCIHLRVEQKATARAVTAGGGGRPAGDRRLSFEAAKRLAKKNQGPALKELSDNCVLIIR